MTKDIIRIFGYGSIGFSCALILRFLTIYLFDF